MACQQNIFYFFIFYFIPCTPICLQKQDSIPQIILSNNTFITSPSRFSMYSLAFGLIIFLKKKFQKLIDIIKSNTIRYIRDEM
jgi:hypothetical protein